MTETERIYFDKYVETKDVDADDCYIGGHNCHTCAHCASHDSDWHEFERDYCTMARR